jgi:hypothetical protein
MTTLEILSEAPQLFAERENDLPEMNELLELQLHAARRSDQLARRFCSGNRATDRRIWLRAELEVFERLERRKR